MTEKITVGRYTIIERRQAGEVMIAVGHCPTEAQPYGTWKAYEHSGFKSFDQGHYFSTRQEAMTDYFRRLAEAWEYYTPAKSQRKKPRQNDSPAR